MSDRKNIDFLKELNISFKNESRDRIEETVDLVIKVFLEINPFSQSGGISNMFSVVSNYIKMIVKNKNININYVLSSVIKHTNNYVGLYFIGMLIRNGANPNVYFPYSGYGNLHIIAILSLRSQGANDPYFRFICNLLRILGSDINYPALSYQDIEGDLDINFVETIADGSEEKYNKSTVTVKDFVLNNGKYPDENLQSFLNSLSSEDKLNIIIASDKIDLFKNLLQTEFFRTIKENPINTTILYTNFSTAAAYNIARNLTKKDIPLIDYLINGQPIPLYAATSSMDEELFSIYIYKGSLIKYLTINHLIIYYKFFKQEDIMLYRNNYYMLLEAVKIGADLDTYQLDLLSTAADYSELDNIRSAYLIPKWKKLCSVIQEKPRQELKQMAFDLNLDYNMSEKKICNKLKQISLIDKIEYYESAIKRQEERISSDVSSNDEYLGDKKLTKSLCNPKTTVINNPYAYNDARMAFYKDPKDGEVWCFTSDTFTNLIASEINPYNGNPLPLKFVETIKAQVNILKELGVFDINKNIKDSLKDIYERSTINNVKTEYAFNTVVKCLSLFGVSEERYSTLKTITQEETILRDICGVQIKHFDILSFRQKIMTTSRVIYSISKSKNIDPSEIYEKIAQAIVGYEDYAPSENKINYNNYLKLLEQ